MLEGDDRVFALGNDYYRLDQYKEAAEAFSQIQSYDWLYNAGNAFYKFWEEIWTIEEKIALWEQSLEFYQQSMTQKRTLDAEQNSEFVRWKLDELLQQQKEEQEKQEEQEESENQEKTEQSQQQESQEEDWDETWEQQQENNQWESWEESQDIIPQPRGEQYKLWEQSELWDLTPEQEAEIERYIDDLKKQEKQNQRFFNKSMEPSSSRDIFDAFFPSQNSDEKDW